jgi:hypothetical protein
MDISSEMSILTTTTQDGSISSSTVYLGKKGYLHRRHENPRKVRVRVRVRVRVDLNLPFDLIISFSTNP